MHYGFGAPCRAAEAAAGEGRVRQRRRVVGAGGVGRPRAAGRHRDVVTGQLLNVFGKHRRDAKAPRRQDDQREQNIVQAHKRPAHGRAVAPARGLLIEGQWQLGRLACGLAALRLVWGGADDALFARLRADPEYSPQRHRAHRVAESATDLAQPWM